MAELLTVIVVIGVLAAAASPSFLRLLADRRVTDAATEITNMYRFARARAMGRGSAVAVVWDDTAALSSAPSAHFLVFERVQGVASLGQGLNPLLPSSNCFGPAFQVGDANSQFLMMFDERRERYEPAVSTFVDADGDVIGSATICFTPRGRAWVDYGGGWVTMNGVPRVQTENTLTGGIRHTIIPPSGAARLVLTGI